MRERLVALDARRAGLVRRRRSRARAARGSSARRAGRARPGRSRPASRRASATKPCTSRWRSGSVCGDRRQEPGRALEEPGARVLGAARLGAADRVAADEARRAGGGRDDARLRRADVGDGRRLAASPASTAATCAGELRDRRRDDDELGARDAPPRASRPAVDARRARPRPRARPGRGPSRRRRAPRAARGERDGGADQPGADDRRAADGHVRPTRSACAASARRGGTRGRATAARSGADRRASRSASTSCSSSTSSAPPRHSVTSSPVNSRCTPPGQTPSSPARGEEALDLAP